MDESVALKFVTFQNGNRYECVTRGTFTLLPCGSLTFAFLLQGNQPMQISVSGEGKKVTVMQLGQGGYTAVIEQDRAHKLTLPHGLQVDVICNKIILQKTDVGIYLMVDYFFAESGKNSRTKMFLKCTY